MAKQSALWEPMASSNTRAEERRLARINRARSPNPPTPQYRAQPRTQAQRPPGPSSLTRDRPAQLRGDRRRSPSPDRQGRHSPDRNRGQSQPSAGDGFQSSGRSQNMSPARRSPSPKRSRTEPHRSSTHTGESSSARSQNMSSARRSPSPKRSRAQPSSSAQSSSQACGGDGRPSAQNRSIISMSPVGNRTPRATTPSRQVATTSSAATANPPKLACCNIDATSLRYHTGNLRCDNNSDCRIASDAEFWGLKGSNEGTVYCLNCYETLKPNPRKGKFEKKKNVNDAEEPILECKKCRRNFHLCCSFFYGEDLSKFICEVCSGVRVKKTIDGEEKCPLAAFMTKKMMDFLASRMAVVEHPIRICGFSEPKSAKTSTVVPPVLKYQFVKKYSETMNYVSRALHVYQRVDDVDVITFAIYTAEYVFRGEEEKWCVIDYIDSLPYFIKFDGVQKKEIHYLLIHSYFQYMSGLGFKKAHLWSNPPPQGDDYVFNIHPFDQPFLNPTALIVWYHKLLKDGQDKKILAGFKNFKDSGFQKPVDIPVFVGSLWSHVFQEVTKPTTKEVFNRELEEKKERHGEDNFFIVIAPTARQPQETPHNTHEILGDREKLWAMCVDKNWQFETIRRAKYSSVGLIRMTKK